MRIGFSLLLWVCAPLAVVVRSDVVECENGDRYNGRVILVDEQTVKLQNDIAGILTVPRARVTTISFRGAKTPATAVMAPANVRTNLNAFSPNQAFKFDPATMEKVQNEILGTAGPEANQMYKDMLNGLMSGKLDVGDVRVKAQEALKELKQLQKDLGDDDAAALLGSYGSILENFLKDTPPPKTTSKAVNPTEPAGNEPRQPLNLNH